jgi:hypothetical protein
MKRAICVVFSHFTIHWTSGYVNSLQAVVFTSPQPFYCNVFTFSEYASQCLLHRLSVYNENYSNVRSAILSEFNCINERIVLKICQKNSTDNLIGGGSKMSIFSFM